jgi:hypothetical protein
MLYLITLCIGFILGATWTGIFKKPENKNHESGSIEDGIINLKKVIRNEKTRRN